MAVQSETVAKIVGQVLAHCEFAGETMARIWADNTFREFVERRDWSWRVASGQFILPTATTTGTVSLTRGSDIVTGVGTPWTQALHKGLQFRLGNTVPISTVKSVISATSIQLDKPWGGANIPAGTKYSIYQAYVSVPDDFETFLSIINPRAQWQMGYGVEARELDQRDPSRSFAGANPYLLASRTFTDFGNGYFSDPVQVVGTGPIPAFGGVYDGQLDAIYIIEIVTVGTPGVGTWHWRKDSGAYTAEDTIPSDGTVMSDGLSVAFDPDQEYVQGDIFVVSATAKPGIGVPQFEVWPHCMTQLVIPYLYIKRMPDLSELGVVPFGVPGDVIMLGSLARCARWPGRSKVEVNPYYQIATAQALEGQFLARALHLEVVDDDMYPQDVSYYHSMPFAPEWNRDWLQRDRADSIYG